jgi:putative DNA primase/helicase
VSRRAGLAEVVRALGGDLLAGGRRALVPGPGHSAADRSVSLLLDRERVVAHSFAGDDWRDVLDELRCRNLIDWDGRLLGAGTPAFRAVSPSVAQRRRCAQALWAEGFPVARRLAERHARLRGVGRALGDALRHHPAVPSAIYLGRGLRRPALLAAVRDADGEVCAVEVTYLAADGGRARMGLPRKTVGVLPPSAAVRLDPAGPHLLVAEGVFSALSASEHFGLPVWALLSTSNLRRWTPPHGVTAVTIAADWGADGERSARVLAARLRALGLTVVVAWPPRAFGDWNEAQAAERRREEGLGKGEPDGRVVRADGSETL